MATLYDGTTALWAKALASFRVMMETIRDNDCCTAVRRGLMRAVGFARNDPRRGRTS